MRGLKKVLTGKGRALSFSNVSIQKHFNVATNVSLSMVSRRQASFMPYAVKTEWIQHPFKASPASPDDSKSFEQATRTKAKKHIAYVALGSNLGDRITWIETACREMEKRGIKVKRTSCLWETEPMYVVDQENFLNGACEIETSLEPLQLLDELQGIENTMGRQKVIDKGPRNIDLDILLYDDEVIVHERLMVPHPLMLEREFVLRPLAELIPGKALDPTSPWKVTQDYLNALPPSSTPISTLTPLSTLSPPIRALKSNRQTHVMGILNLTPDSFSDGNKLLIKPSQTHSQGKNTAHQLTGNKLHLYSQSGVPIIVDIGGQSSAPNAVDVSVDEEIARVVPTIKWMRNSKGFRNNVISIDTYRAAVAQATVEAGADIINDVSAGRLDLDMLPTMARLGKTVCLMHMRGTPSTMNKLVDYPDGLIPTIAQELLQRVKEAEEAGIRRWRIILDPGIGFAKTVKQNLEILRRLEELRDWPGLKGLPWLVGSSRKGFIGKITGVEEPRKRTWGTAATITAAVQGGADIVRVHDVKEMAQVAKMSDAIWRS